MLAGDRQICSMRGCAFDFGASTRKKLRARLPRFDDKHLFGRAGSTQSRGRPPREQCPIRREHSPHEARPGTVENHEQRAKRLFALCTGSRHAVGRMDGHDGVIWQASVRCYQAATESRQDHGG